MSFALLDPVQQRERVPATHTSRGGSQERMVNGRSHAEHMQCDPVTRRLKSYNTTERNGEGRVLRRSGQAECRALSSVPICTWSGATPQVSTGLVYADTQVWGCWTIRKAHPSFRGLSEVIPCNTEDMPILGKNKYCSFLKPPLPNTPGLEGQAFLLFSEGH